MPTPRQQAPGWSRHSFGPSGAASTPKPIVDKRSPCEHKSWIDPLARAYVPVWIDPGVKIARGKSMVIDDQVTLVGSMNWTASAARNSEDLDLIASKTVAAAYSSH
jgi:phosphatidylserine/phosphatidylglycerophosphate/cardiolipin synthase-like enzyme